MSRPSESVAIVLRETAAWTVAWIGVGAAFGFLYLTRYAWCALFAGAVVAIALKPVINRLTRLGLSRPVSSGIVFGTILFITAAALVWVAPLAGEQLSSLGQRLPEIVGDLGERLAKSSFAPVRALGGLLSPLLQSPSVANREPMIAQAANLLGDALCGGYVALFILVMAAAWNEASNSAGLVLHRLIPVERHASVFGFLDEAEKKLGAYVRGQLLVCALSATVASIACFSLGLPYALLLGLGTGLCEVVPLIGPSFAGSVVLIIALVSVPSRAPWIALIFLLNHLTQSYLVTPRVMDKTVGVTPFAVLFSVVVFGALLGAPGGVLAVPFAAVLQLVLDRFVFHPDQASFASEHAVNR